MRNAYKILVGKEITWETLA